MNLLKRNLGKRIKQLRKNLGLTQEQLAAKSDMGYPYLGLIERGERNPTLEFIGKISEGLGIKVYQLFLFTDEDILESENKIKEESIEDVLDRHNEKTKKKLLTIVRAILNLNGKKRNQTTKQTDIIT